MKEFIKKHKKAFAACVIAVLGALTTLITSLFGACTSSGMWKADFERKPERDVYPIYRAEELPSANNTYPFSPPKSDISEVGGFEQ